MSKPLKTCDLALRNGHQSSPASRMRTEDMLPIAETIDWVGYWAVEVWGATFDCPMRFLDEDPWERIRRLDKPMMLLRGQNVIGCHHRPDDVLEHSIFHAHKAGIDVFRIFDALNDVRNMGRAMEVVKREGGHFPASICYTIGPPYRIDYFVDVAGRLAEMGADSICIKDMAGLINPYAAYELVGRLKSELELAIHLHSHSASGMATTAMLKAVEARVDIVDTAISALSLTTSYPPTESIVTMLRGRERDTGLDLAQLADIAGYFGRIRRKYASFESGMLGVDVRVLQFQIPGGMLSNLVSQLRHQGAEGKYEAVLDKVPRLRSDLGYPLLVTPSSQLFGTQATLNVVLGERYKVIPGEVRQYVRGYHGRPPAPINPEVKRMAIGNEEPVDCRPADLVPSGMERAREEVTSFLFSQTPSEEVVLSYALFPEIAKPFLERQARGRNGNEPLVAAVAGLLLERAARAREKAEKERARTGVVASPWRVGWRARGGRWTDAGSRGPIMAAAEEFTITLDGVDCPVVAEHEKIIVDGRPFAVSIDENGTVLVDGIAYEFTLEGDEVRTGEESYSLNVSGLSPERSAAVGGLDAIPVADVEVSAGAVIAIMPGKITWVTVKEGDKVTDSEPVCVLEAMKMENELRVEGDGVVTAVQVKPGDDVEKDELLIEFERSGGKE